MGRVVEAMMVSVAGIITGGRRRRPGAWRLWAAVVGSTHTIGGRLSASSSNEQLKLPAVATSAHSHTGAVMLRASTIGTASFERGCDFKRCITRGTATGPTDQRHLLAVGPAIELAADDHIALTLPHQDRVERGQDFEIDGVDHPVSAGHSCTLVDLSCSNTSTLIIGSFGSGIVSPTLYNNKASILTPPDSTQVIGFMKEFLHL
jgi:hypothetical protein